MDWNKQIEGLLGSPQFNLGLGLLAASGPRRGPRMSFGQVLAEGAQFANQQQRQFQELQANRQALQQNQRQQQNLQKLQGLLSQPSAASIPASIRRPGAIQDQQNQLQGLLAQINPQQFTSSLIQSQFAQQSPQTSAKFADYIALGGDPSDMAAYQKFSNPGTEENSARLALLAAQLEDQLQDNAQQAQEARTSRATIQSGIESGVNDMIKLFDVNNKLNDTFLQSGLGGSEQRRGLSGLYEGALNLFGGDSSRVESLNESYDLFKKISQDFANNSMAMLGGSGSNFRLQSMVDANANPDASPSANRYVIASNLQELLTQARANNIELPANVRESAMAIINQVFSPPPAGFVED